MLRGSNRLRSMKRFLLFLLLAVGASVVAAPPAAKFGRLVAGTVAPEFTAIGVDGKEINLAAFKDKTVVLNFWTVNRGPAESLQAAATDYANLGLVVLGICSGATREEFETWRTKWQGSLTYPIAWDPAAKNREASIAGKLFGIGVYPSTGVIDPAGKVVGGFVGFGAQSSDVLRGYLCAAGLPIAPEPLPPSSAPPSEPADSKLKPGELAPDFTALDPAGHPVKLSDFAGKIVVLDFWATWCGPCLASLPHTQRVAAATKMQDVVVFAACTSDTRERFDTWLKANAAKYPDIVFANDPNGRDTPATFAERASARLYGVNGIPTQFVIGRDGKIVEIFSGYGEGDDRLETALAKLGVKP
jgi:peroxiredoxin